MVVSGQNSHLEMWKNLRRNSEASINQSPGKIYIIGIISSSQLIFFKFKIINNFASISSDKSNESTNTEPAPTSTSSHQNDFAANTVIIGLRSSIRSVSSGKTVALFISSKIRPRYIIDQIILMTVTKNVNSRIFCVPDMDVALLDVLGFSCQCLAMLEEENEIWNWSLEKSKQFPLPKSFKKSSHPATEAMDVQSMPIVVNESSNVDLSTLYLRRQSPDQRAFIPHGTILRKDKTNDFISLGEMNPKMDIIQPKHQMISKNQQTERSVAQSITKQSNVGKFRMKKKMATPHHDQHFHSNKVNYLPLKINRVQPNAEKNRNKNKKKKDKTNKK